MNVETKTLKRVRIGGATIGTLGVATMLTGVLDLSLDSLPTVNIHAQKANINTPYPYELRVSNNGSGLSRNNTTLLIAGFTTAIGAILPTILVDKKILSREEDEKKAKARKKTHALIPTSEYLEAKYARLNRDINGIKKIDLLSKKMGFWERRFK